VTDTSTIGSVYHTKGAELAYSEVLSDRSQNQRKIRRRCELAFCEIAKDAATIQQPTTATMRVIIILSQTMVNVYDESRQ